MTPAATVTLISSSSTLMTRAGSPRSNSDGSSLVSAAKVSVLFGVHGISDTHTHIYIERERASTHEYDACFALHQLTHPFRYLSSILSDASQKKTDMYAYAYLTAIFTPSFSFEQKKPSFHECPSPVETYQGHNEPDSTDMRVSTYQSPWTRFCLVVFTARWWCWFLVSEEFERINRHTTTTRIVPHEPSFLSLSLSLCVCARAYHIL